MRVRLISAFCLVASLAAFPFLAGGQLIPLPSPAQADSKPQAAAEAATNPFDPLGRQTPRSSVRGFVSAATAGSYARAAEYLQLSSGMSPQGPQLARQVMAVLDNSAALNIGKLSDSPYGSLVNPSPKNGESIGTASTPNGQYELYVVRVQDKQFGWIWLISQQTVEQAPEIYELIDSGFRSQLPEWSRRHRFLNLEIWQWIGVLLLVAFAYAVSFFISRVMWARLAVFLSSTYGPLMVQAAEHTVLPLQWCIAVLTFQLASHVLFLPLVARSVQTRAGTSLLIVLFTWLVIRATDAFSEWVRLWFTSSGRTASESVLPVMRRVGKLVLLIAGFVLLLESVGINAASVWTGLGIGGIAVALAAQKTVENLFGGVTIFADQTIRVGDVCKIGDQTGSIEDIGLRATKLRTVARTLVSVPNGALATMQLENISKRGTILFRHQVRLRNTTKSEGLQRVLTAVKQMLDAHPMVDPVPARVRLISIGDACFEIEMFAHIRTVVAEEFLETQGELLLQIIEIVEGAGVRFALPIEVAVPGRA